MGNCLHPVERFSVDNSRTQFTFENWNYSYEDNASYELTDDYNLTGAAPCYSCNLLDSSSLPFFILTSVLGLLASGGILFTILRPFFHWQICPSWPILAQLAVGSALFSISVTILAPGLYSAHSTALCNLGYWAWNLETLKYIHSAICFTIFTVLPLTLLAAKGLKTALGKGPGPWVSVLWLWFIFWWPHGMVLMFDALVRSKAMLLQTCQSQKMLDVMLDVAEALAMLHCVATPLLLALFCHQTTRRSLPSLSLPAR
ncbi:rCG20141, isoform CRA_a [Rattus norvegicus]|uniref:Atypical chemokine receptor 1 n=1 Tax=Rattus norvegicus TaxID=10116 RepID=A6JG84_RAT|nr:rCG20141, isoform CRA_a [Rattus norvegicus]